MSISELGEIDVLSVSKTPETLNTAPAAIYVITHDDILRSGAVTVPEMLRLAPNLQVYQESASQYVVTARGFNGSSADQNFSNKLLVLIDGRTVYSPLYSGVYWDMQQVAPDDIDRIEVISGPGATLWGSNAVNGVINIVTRSSAQTEGGSLDVYGGNLSDGVSLRYGGRLGETATYRVYGLGQWEQDTPLASGAKASDQWSLPQGGFRVDWAPSSADMVTVQGDASRGPEAPDDGIIGGANVLSRWTRSWQNGASLQVQAYYDHEERISPSSGGFRLNTVDLDMQNNFAVGPNQIVWGGGIRSNQYQIYSVGSLSFSPSARTLNLGDLFVQDTVTVAPTVKLVGGLKLEEDPYIGLSALPDLRLTWTPAQSLFLWTAVSRAVRSPTPFDRDVVEKIGSLTFLTGGSQFESERVVAYEAGGRLQPLSRLSVSVQAYYNVYDDLRSIEPNPATLLPLYWGNGMKGRVWGVEAWADYQLLPWWRLSASLDVLREAFGFEPGASGLLGVTQAANDPQHQASLKSSMNLGRQVTLDAALRYMDALPDPSVPAYVELNARIGWNITEKLQLAVTGENLLHPYHQEYPSPATPVPRQAYASLRLKF